MKIHVEVAAIIDAGAATVYAILADYRGGHRQILPRRYFPELQIEQGGNGAGTRARVTMETLGVTRTFVMDVSEPQPGRVLVEADASSGAITTFTVAPTDDGRRACVTIATDWQVRGLGGFVQRWLAPPMLRRIYAEELDNLARAAAAHAAC